MALAPTRDPYPSELEFFRKNPHVRGMAASDDRVIVNPFSRLTPEEAQAVIELESARIFMRRNYQARPSRENFPLTEQQRQTFGPGGALEYRAHPAPADPEQSIRETVASRMLGSAKDPSAGNVTPEQQRFIEELQFRMNTDQRNK